MHNFQTAIVTIITFGFCYSKSIRNLTTTCLRKAPHKNSEDAANTLLKVHFSSNWNKTKS